MNVQDPCFLTIPGWMGSTEQHWQSQWERIHGMSRVEQDNWIRPLRGDWVARLEDVVLEQTKPCVLVAHSLGCILVASWAFYSLNTHKVKAAFMVAPADVENELLKSSIHGWSNVSLQKLPFRSKVIASKDDPFCNFKKSRLLAEAWGAELVDAGYLGHINADSGVGGWEQGFQILQKFITDKE